MNSSEDDESGFERIGEIASRVLADTVRRANATKNLRDAGNPPPVKLAAANMNERGSQHLPWRKRGEE